MEKPRPSRRSDASDHELVAHLSALPRSQREPLERMLEQWRVMRILEGLPTRQQEALH